MISDLREYTGDCKSELFFFGKQPGSLSIMQVRSHSSSQCLYGFRLIIDFNIVLLKSLGTEKCLNEIKPVKLKAFIRLLKRKIDVAEPFNAGNRIRNRTIPQ